MDIRLNLLKDWLSDELKLNVTKLASASADASFRRYFRATTDDGVWVIMDAPPEKEPFDQFVKIAETLIKRDIHAPKVIAQNHTKGFLLLEDLGSRTYLDELEGKAALLYSDAITALIKIQQGQQPGATEIPAYTAQLLEQEMDLFENWFLNRHLCVTLCNEQLKSWKNIKAILINTCLEQPQVWVHRDYHSRNLMITNDNSPGVIDFQDMVTGPIAYDLASLFKDCYIEWPRARQLSWLKEYYHKAQAELGILTFSFKDLIRWFDLTGLQRHLKVLGIFCRLYYRDGKEQYLKDLPLVGKYVLEVLELYPELGDFKSTYADYIRKSQNLENLK